MVKQDKFTVEIVNAETKTTFPEHAAANGEIYVEVEPKAEYFIRINTDSEEVVLAFYSVDGKDLGYHTAISKTDPSQDAGLWEFKGGKEIHHALKFTKTPVRDGGAPSPVSWTGKIEVTFYEAVFSHYFEHEDRSNTWKGGDVSYVMGISDPDKKKGVKSDQGSTLEIKASARRRARYLKGAKLKTFTLNYCSTLGLIQAGILPKPPNFEWNLLREQRPRDPAELMEDIPEPQLTEIKCNVYGVDQMVKGWMYDLTEC